MLTGQFCSFPTLGWTLEQARKLKAEVAAENTSAGVSSCSTQGTVLPSRQAGLLSKSGWGERGAYLKMRENKHTNKHHKETARVHRNSRAPLKQQGHIRVQMCLTQATRNVLQTTLSQVHTLNLMAGVVPFSILDINSFLIPCTWQALWDSSQIPANTPISDHLNEVVAKQHLFPFSFGLFFWGWFGLFGSVFCFGLGSFLFNWTYKKNKINNLQFLY